MDILFVFSDQQRYSALGANGNTLLQTPNLDKTRRLRVRQTRTKGIS